jgi:hypothetical protein
MALAIVAVLEGDPPRRVRLDVSGLTGADTFSIVRVQQDGEVPVRGETDRVVLGDAWVAYDYEYPLGADQGFAYVVETTTGTTVERSSPTATIVVESDDVWLRDLFRPERSVVLRVVSLDDLGYEQRAGSFYVIGRANPVVVSDVRAGFAGTMEVATLDSDERAALLAILVEGLPLMLQLDSKYDVPTSYVSVGAVVEHRASAYGDEPARTWDLPLTQIDRPALALVSSDYRYSDVAAAYDTYRVLLDSEASYLDLYESVG